MTVPPYAERRRRIESEPLPRNIGALLDDAAAAAPHRLAWDFFEQGERITYAALRERVDRLAAGLARAGVRKDSHVGVMLPNVAAMPTTWLALARTGRGHDPDQHRIHAARDGLCRRRCRSGVSGDRRRSTRYVGGAPRSPARADRRSGLRRRHSARRRSGAGTRCSTAGAHRFRASPSTATT